MQALVSSITGSTRPTHGRPPARRLAAFLLVLAVASVLSVAFAASAASGGVDRPLTTEEAATLTGGTCSTCGSGGSTGSDTRDEPSPQGSAYWVTTRQSLSSYDPGVAEIVYRYNNYDDRELVHTYELERRVMRNVGFSGGYANYFRASIGGEVNTVTLQGMKKTLDPWEGLKVYRRQETRRYTVYGTRYQDYDDGSRRVVARSSGPYTTSNSVFGFVTYSLR